MPALPRQRAGPEEPDALVHRGWYRLVKGDDPVRELDRGKLEFELYGMKLRGRWTLALLAAALIAAAIYVSIAGRPDRPAVAGTLLYPQLEQSLDDVTAIRILGPGATTAVTVKRAKTGWQ